ncbi:MAG: hypothetical protein ABI597_03480 [Gammaproteobacteria bacterium]
MFEKLIRFKHVVLIIIGLFIAPLNLFDTIFVQPIVNIGYSENSSIALVFSLLITQAIYLGWIAFQEEAVTATRVKNYFNALPISPVKNYIVDLAVLFIANNIFWIPIIVALINAPYAAMHATLAPYIFVIRILTLTVSILAIQMQWIYRQYFSFVFLTITNLLLYLGSIVLSQRLSLLVAILAFVSALLFSFPKQLKLNIPTRFFSSRSKYSLALPGYSRFQFLKLTYSVLIKKYLVESFVRCTLSIAILIFGCFAIVLGDSLNAQLWSVALLSVVALAFSGFFPLLKESREQYSLYFRSLPISQLYWYMLDWLAITILMLILGGVYASTLMIYQKMSLSEVFWIITSSGVLVLLLCYVRNRFRTFNALLSIIVTVAWVTIGAYL